MKYVIFLNLQFGFEIPVVFHSVVPHESISMAGCKAVAAGFYTPDQGAHGESIGLGLRSRPQDTEIITSNGPRL